MIKYLWQLPQNLLGLLVIFFTDAIDCGDYYLSPKHNFGVSLGKYIIFGGTGFTQKALRHEQGHQKQSLYLGWLYLIIIGLPSLLGNVWDRLAHRHWAIDKRVKWYYNQPWEKWADRLGGVVR